ncbi:MAG: hypothetical protein RQ753_04715 [Desulfurivibrionaceae bacterium]|nr:hypothetical protein [Desulfobulbales bacterium]MDT8334978.1 hypothetical protein [Desulfurivibrionaceae bacterium]
MITHCPNCNKSLNFNENQQAKIQSALAALQTGTLKLKCPHCKVPMELLSDGTLADWRQKTAAVVKRERKMPEPPKPPDINWLTKTSYEDIETIKEIPKVLVMIDPGPVRDAVVEAMVELFFQPIKVESVAEGVEQMRAIEFDSIILHSRFGGEPFMQSRIHENLKELPMATRRYIFYVLIGPELSTLYTLEAFSYSVNMVINEKDVEYIKNIYRKGRAESDALFGPYSKILRELGVTIA